MAAGAFSDDGVVDAAKKLIPVYVDCTARGANQDLLQKYGVSGFPTVLFTDSQGNEVERLKGRDAQSVINQIESVVKAHSKAPAASDGAGSLAEVAEQAVKDGKLVAVMFVDPKKAKKQEALQAVLDADEVAQLKERFVWVEQPVKVEGKRNPVARALGVSSGPYLVLIDPRGEGELDKKKVIGKTNNAKKLQETLEKAVEKADSREE